MEDKTLGSSFWWFYDALVIAVFFLAIAGNAKKGFIKSVVVLAAYILSAFLAYMAGSFAGDKIYYSYIKDKNIEAVENAVSDINVNKEIKLYIEQSGYNVDISEEQIRNIISQSQNIDDADERFAEAINTATGGAANVTGAYFKDNIMDKISSSVESRIGGYLPDFAVTNVQPSVSNNTDKIFKTIALLSGDSHNAAEYIEKEYLRPVTIKVIGMLVFVVVFAVLNIIFHILLGGIDKIGDVTGLGKLDSVLGGVLGAVQAAIIVFIIMLIVKITINLNDSNMVLFNEETIENTKLFKYFYNIKILE